jgi:hypothetical protein
MKPIIKKQKFSSANILEVNVGTNMPQWGDAGHGGTVWDLAKTASKIDRAAGIHVLRKFGLLGTYDTVKGSNAENH